jgi:hypothetical protein
MDLLADSRPSVAAVEWTPPDYLQEGSGQEDRWGRLTVAELRRELEGFLKR